MPQTIKVNPIRFINAEPCLLPFSGQGPMPAVLLSFGAEDEKIDDRAVNVVEARQMVVDILESLATLGDPLAQAIGEEFFSGPRQDTDEFDTGESGDGCNDGDC
jgi:hypothetical protein